MFDSAILTIVNNSEDQFKSRNLKALTNIRFKNQKRPTIGQLNINCIRNKFGILCSKTISNLDLLLVLETKLNNLFTTAQFLMGAFCRSYRIDCCLNGWDLLL